MINVLDLTEMCAHFPPESPIGAEVHNLLDTYKRLNLKVSYTPMKIEFYLQNYLKFTDKPCLAKELNDIFHA